MQTVSLFSSLRRAVLALSLALVLGASGAVWAAATRGEPSGTQQLQAHLPVGTTARDASCEQLAHAVNRAARARHASAPAILSAALTRGAKADPNPADAKLACPCVGRLLRAALQAAPEKAAGLLEVATSLNPACAESLEAMVKNLDDKNVVDGKDAPAAGSADAADPWDPSVRDVSDRLDPDEPIFGYTGFGVGFGPGFPGSPGFTGSPPGGAIALPPPPAVITAVSNG